MTIYSGSASAILTVLIGRWLALLLTRSAARLMERAHVNPLVIRFAQTLIFFGAMAAVPITALSQAGMHVLRRPSPEPVCVRPTSFRPRCCGRRGPSLPYAPCRTGLDQILMKGRTEA